MNLETLSTYRWTFPETEKHHLSDLKKRVHAGNIILGLNSPVEGASPKTLLGKLES